jgi:hypothetical protein
MVVLMAKKAIFFKYFMAQMGLPLLARMLHVSFPNRQGYNDSPCQGKVKTLTYRVPFSKL